MEFSDGPVGKTWENKDFPQDIIHDHYQDSIVSRAIEFLTRSPSRSVLIAGEAGTGKSTIISLTSKKLAQSKWKILVAGAIDIIAGQMYIGMLDAQIKNVIDALSRKPRKLWMIPKFHEMYYAGRHDKDPSGILDRILPVIEKSHITILGEINTGELEKLLKLRPQVRTVFEIIRLEPLSEQSTIELANKWTRLPAKELAWSNISDKELREAMTLSKQFLGFRKEPGDFMNFLKLTESVAQANNDKAKLSIKPEDFIFSLSALSGLPLSIIDDRKKLDIEELRKQFYKRIIGQEEAVEALIERIAMIKAGFTDSTRPLGIFMFVGPTGTGKTEIAKTLAEFLFGSPDKMIRIDMSEFQTPDSLNRLIGDSATTESVSLVDEIRKNPFSVILLDEFEKANPNVWDLFLQLFDDARLTDLSGNSADFRHAIIIMTSNIGSAIPKDHGIGFSNAPGTFDAEPITKSLYKTFKPEFINRIDRVIIFNPLSKATMRQILKNELNKVLQRRGFRQRQWAVEWDESAIEFLLEKGFSRNLGARPIKRAIEQYLLAPLAITIVNHQFPDGDQFLFIKRNDNSLQVDFIDPDMPDVSWKERQQAEKSQTEKAKSLTLKTIAFEPKGILAEIEALQAAFGKLQQHTGSEEWIHRKEHLLLQMSEPDFWNRKDHKKYLSEIEYRDRFEQSLATVGSVLDRFADLRKKYSTFSADLVKQVAERIMLMDVSLRAFEQNETQDALVRISYEPMKEAEDEQAVDFWKRITQMYVQWAKNRKMKHRVIYQDMSAECFDFIIVVEGFAAYQVLEKEKGIHVWEESKKENKYERIKMRVDVRALPEELSGRDAKYEMIKKLFDNPGSDLNKITRKYRSKPSPLVSDIALGWRSGRLDKISAGDFDLVE